MVPKLLWSPFLYLPAFTLFVLVEPMAGLVTALGLLALWAGLRAEQA